MNASQNARFAYIRGQIVPVSDALIHVSDLAIQRGYGIFDFFKIEDGHPFFINDHLDRFFESARILKLQVPAQRDEIEQAIHQLIARNEMPSSGIKLILTGGYSADGYAPGESNLILTQHALKLPTNEQVEKGVRVISYPYFKEFPAAKSINYMMGIWLLDVLQQERAADVLYYHDEVISEFPRSNIFMVDHSGTLLTPSRNILKGVTRKNVISLASRSMTVLEKDITRDDLYGAAEVFLTSTTKRILPIVEVDHRVIGNGKPGPIALGLLTKLLQLEKQDKGIKVA
ncbi:aminotransferase class IV [Chryseolinea sp. T2]|uniref:aminotransferase class IV n=1 Tax=Chryseolinea sp. T2 TaxID=3129255 RepID=UPI0030789CBE